MGYFSNGTEGDRYQDKWCSRCLHQNDDTGRGCPVWNAHLLVNYEACNDPKHVLHMLIPRKHGGIGNERCTMFVERGLMSNLALQKFESEASK